jgi:hypothetical protein
VENYPSNSYNSEKEVTPRIRRENGESGEKRQRNLRVVKGVVVRRKKPLGARLLDVFLQGEDFRTATIRVAADILAPAAKEMVVNAVKEVVEGMLYGENRPAGRRSSSSDTGHTSYNSISSRRSNDRLSARDRAMHNFDSIEFESEDDANEALEMMWEILDEDEVVTVSDFYTIAGMTSDAQDTEYGWKNIASMHVVGLRNGKYKIRMPKPIPIRPRR